MPDARNRREPQSYVQAVVRYAEAANIHDVENQLTFARQGITSELRAFADPPDDTTTVEAFIRTLELKKNTWFEDAHRHVMPLKPSYQ